MNTAKEFDDLLDRLKARRSGDRKQNVSLLGLIFCRPDKKLAREEILPSLEWYHRRSGTNIDFYFAGFDNAPPQGISSVVVSSGIPSQPEWNFDPNAFDEFRMTVQNLTSWRYSGGSDFMLVNCNYDDNGKPRLDFTTAAILILERLRQQNRLPDVGMFFEEIFRYCEARTRPDENWGYGVDARPGSGLLELCNAFLISGPSKELPKMTSDFSPPSQLEVKQDTEVGQELITGYFRYDLPARALIITPSGQKHIVDHRYAEVLSKLLAREPGPNSVRVSHLDHLTIAVLFEIGRWKEEFPSISNRELERKSRENCDRIKNQQKLIAQEFRRQFSRWLRERQIEPDRVITADRKHDGYKLGNGWHPKRMAIGDSEVGLGFASRQIENYSDSSIGRRI